jgi:hypothetical protein
VTVNQLSLQTMHDLECFINLCVCISSNTASAVSHLLFLQPRLQVRLRVRREPRLWSHREMDKKRLCGTELLLPPPLQVAPSRFIFTCPSQAWMNLAIPLFRRQLPLDHKP